MPVAVERATETVHIVVRIGAAAYGRPLLQTAVSAARHGRQHAAVEHDVVFQNKTLAGKRLLRFVHEVGDVGELLRGGHLIGVVRRARTRGAYLRRFGGGISPRLYALRCGRKYGQEH